MLGHQDEIASTFRRSCSNLEEKLKIGLYKIYNSHKDSCQGCLPNPEESVENILDPLVNFERKLLQYIRVKEEFQAENKNLQLKLKELQLNLKAKNLCISKLKEDIASHYMQIEFLRKHNEKLEGDLGNAKKKLDQFERSEGWLKKHLFSTQRDTKYERGPISDEFYLQYNRNRNVYREGQIQKIIENNDSIDNKTDDSYKNMEIRKFHVKLIEVCHENIFLKQALQKMKNINDREDKLKRLLKSYHNTTPIKLENEQKISHNKFDKSIENEKNGQISQLNSIIDSMRLTVLQLQFEKRNLELSVFKIREYFLKIKDMQRKLKLMLRNSNQSFNSTFLGNSCVIGINSSVKQEGEIQELIKTIKSLKLEKLQMEIEHHEELHSFTNKFGEMQHILHDIKTVCDDLSEDTELCERTSEECEIIQRKSKENRGSENDIAKVSEKQSICMLDIQISPPVPTRRLTSHVSYENYVPECSIVPLNIHNRMNLIEEQLKRVDLVCSKNLDLLSEVINNSSISQTRELKSFASLREKSITEEKNRFDKYKRFLLRSMKEYRKSYKIKQKQYETLRNLYNPVILELKRLKLDFYKNGKCWLNSKESKDLPELIQRIDNLTERIEMHTNTDEGNVVAWKILNSNSENIMVASRKDEIEDSRTISDMQFSEKQEKSTICLISEHQMKNGKTFDGTDQSIDTLREHSDISKTLIEQLKTEKSILQTALTQRDHILGKIFNSFKRKIESVTEEINEKYFLQRLCNDLRSVIKVYGCQNKILKEALESNNICTRTSYIQNTLRRNSANNTEDYIRGLLKYQKNSWEMQETFSDIHSRLESMKKDLSLLQNVAIKR